MYDVCNFVFVCHDMAITTIKQFIILIISYILLMYVLIYTQIVSIVPVYR